MFFFFHFTMFDMVGNDRYYRSMNALPPFWELRECKDYPGMVYYYNTNTMTSTWIRPTPFKESQAEEWPPLVYVHHILVKDKDSVDMDKESRKWRNKPQVSRSREQARFKIESLYKSVTKRERTFEDIAMTESDCDKSRPHGGRLGWITRGKMPRRFDWVAFALEVGEVSKPVETELGWHIIWRKS